MAERRMLAKSIIDSDLFMDLPFTAQILYIQYILHADDDGFICNPNKIMRMTGTSNNDYELLVEKRFIIVFDSGVIVITHWKLHNSIRPDRYKQTVYREEMAQLSITQNRAYCIMSPNGIPDDTQLEPQVNIDKIKLDEVSVVQNNAIESFEDQTVLKFGRYQNVLLTYNEFLQLQQEFPSDYEKRIESLSGYMASSGRKYENHLATIRTWADREMTQANILAQKCSGHSNIFLELAGGMNE